MPSTTLTRKQRTAVEEHVGQTLIKREQAASVLKEYEHLDCRVWRHIWTETSEPLQHRPYTVGFVLECFRCNVKRRLWIDRRTGAIEASEYKYPKDYQVHGEDRPSAAEFRKELLRRRKNGLMPAPVVDLR